MSLFKIAIVIFSIFFLSGCQIQDSIVLYNNTNQEILVEQANGNQLWHPQSKLKISDNNADINWENLKWEGNPNEKYFPLFIFHYLGRDYALRLVFPNLPEHYINRENGIREYRFQLENDLTIYAVLPNEQFGTTNRSDMHLIKEFDFVVNSSTF